MHQIEVLVVDDSNLARKQIISALMADNGIKIIGEAENGKVAVKMVHELKPDIVTMDIEMPVMGGLEAIERIMAFNAVPILVITSHGSINTAFAALSKGALEVFAKSDIKNAEELINKIKLLSKVKVITHIGGRHFERKTKVVQEQKAKELGVNKVIAIASSTGGPKMLSTLLAELPKDLPCSVVIAQHIADGFVSGLVEWLNSISELNVKEGVDEEMVTPGTAYISPSERHMGVDNRKRIVLIEKQKKDLYHPSCDILLSSVADVFGTSSIGIILTGMGHDGALGIKKIKNANGITIAQDEKSSIVFGMPKVAIESGCVDKILSIDKISSEIKRLVNNDHLANDILPDAEPRGIKP